VFFNYKNILVSITVILSFSVSSVYAIGAASFLVLSASALFSNVDERSAEEKEKENGDLSDSFFTMDIGKLATLPGFTMAAPAGMAPGWGVVFGAAGALTNLPDSGSGGNETGSAVAMGFGFGDPQKILGGSVTLGVGLINPQESNFNQGDLGISLGHLFTETLTSFAVGAQNVTGWGSGNRDPEISLYAAVTQIFMNNYVPVFVNVGLGNSSFYFLRSSDDVSSRVSPFASVSFYVLPQVSIITDYTSGVASAGVSIVPIAYLPLSVNLGAWDIFSYVPYHDNVSFLGSISYSYSF